VEKKRTRRQESEEGEERKDTPSLIFEQKSLDDMTKKAKWDRYRQTLEKLERLGISYEVLDTIGGHVRIYGEWDIWPTSGTWINIKTGRRGRGLESLIQEL
jgi:hypothetical protein